MQWVKSLVDKVSQATRTEEEPNRASQLTDVSPKGDRSSTPKSVAVRDSSQSSGSRSRKDASHRRRAIISAQEERNVNRGRRSRSSSAAHSVLTEIWRRYTKANGEVEKTKVLLELLQTCVKNLGGFDSVRGFACAEPLANAVARRLVREVRFVWSKKDKDTDKALATLQYLLSSPATTAASHSSASPGKASDEDPKLKAKEPMLNVVESGFCGGRFLLQAALHLATIPGCADAMSVAPLPSTLLQIFSFVAKLPDLKDVVKFMGSEKVFDMLVKQIGLLLARLCRCSSAIQEMQNTDSIYPLFGMLLLPPIQNEDTTKDKHVLSMIELEKPNRIRDRVRTQALRVCRTIAAHQMDKSLCAYIERKKILEEVTKNLLQFLLPIRDHINAVGCLLLCLKHSAAGEEGTDNLLQSFDIGKGYDLLLTTLLWLESKSIEMIKIKESFKVDDEPKEDEIEKSIEKVGTLLDDMMEMIIDLVYVGRKPLQLLDNSSSPYHSMVSPLKENSSSRLNPNSRAHLVRNSKAFHVLQKFFLQSHVSQSQRRILDCILSVYAANYKNFCLLQHLHTLAHIIENFDTFNEEVKESIMQVLVFVVTVVGVVPFQEISVLSLLLGDNPPLSTVQLIHVTVHKLINYSSQYRIIFQEAGLLLMLISRVRSFHEEFRKVQGNKNEHCLQDQAFQEMMYLLALLLQNSAENVRAVDDSGIHHVLLELSFSHRLYVRRGALRVFQQMCVEEYALSNVTHCKVAMLVDSLLSVAGMCDAFVIVDVLLALRDVMISSVYAQESFRLSGGFECIVLLLQYQAGRLVPVDHQRMPADSETVHDPLLSESEVSAVAYSRTFCLELLLLRTLLQCLVGALESHSVNRTYFLNRCLMCVGGTVAQTGVFHACSDTRVALQVLHAVLDLATEEVCDERRLYQETQILRSSSSENQMQQTPILPESSSFDSQKKDTSLDPESSHEAWYASRHTADSVRSRLTPSRLQTHGTLSGLQENAKENADDKGKFKSSVKEKDISPQHEFQKEKEADFWYHRADGHSRDRVIVCNPEIIIVTLDLLVQAVQSTMKNNFRDCGSILGKGMMTRISSLLHEGKVSADCRIHAMGFLLKHYGQRMQSASDPLASQLCECFRFFGAQSPTPLDVRRLLRLLKHNPSSETIATDRDKKTATEDPTTPSPLLLATLDLCRQGRVPPHICFSLLQGHASVCLPRMLDRSWPPANGHTLALWLYIDRLDGKPLALLTLMDDAGKTGLFFSLEADGRVALTYGGARARALFEYRLPERRWIHVVVTHQRQRFQKGLARLVVDGVPVSQCKLAYPSTVATGITAFFGEGVQASSVLAGCCNQQWRLGPAFVLEDVLLPSQIVALYSLGPTYVARLQAAMTQYQISEAITASHIQLVELLALSSGGTLPLGPLDLRRGSFRIAEDHLVLTLNPRLVRFRVGKVQEQSFLNLVKAPASARNGPAAEGPKQPNTTSSSHSVNTHLSAHSSSTSTSSATSLLHTIRNGAVGVLTGVGQSEVLGGKRATVQTHARNTDSLKKADRGLGKQMSIRGGSLSGGGLLSSKGTVETFPSESNLLVGTTTVVFSKEGIHHQSMVDDPNGLPSTRLDKHVLGEVDHFARARAQALASEWFVSGGAHSVCGAGLPEAFESVGGVACCLLLIEQAKSCAEMSAALGILAACLRHNHRNARHWRFARGYQILGAMLQEKERALLLNEASLRTLLLLGGLPGDQPPVVACGAVFSRLLLEFSLWKSASPLCLSLLLSQLRALLSPWQGSQAEEPCRTPQHVIQPLSFPSRGSWAPYPSLGIDRLAAVYGVPIRGSGKRGTGSAGVDLKKSHPTSPTTTNTTAEKFFTKVEEGVRGTHHQQSSQSGGSRNTEHLRTPVTYNATRLYGLHALPRLLRFAFSDWIPLQHIPEVVGLCGTLFWHTTKPNQLATQAGVLGLHLLCSLPPRGISEAAAYRRRRSSSLSGTSANSGLKTGRKKKSRSPSPSMSRPRRRERKNPSPILASNRKKSSPQVAKRRASEGLAGPGKLAGPILARTLLLKDIAVRIRSGMLRSGIFLDTPGGIKSGHMSSSSHSSQGHSGGNKIDDLPAMASLMRLLSPNWCLHFIHRDVHPSSVCAAVYLIVLMYQVPSFASRWKQVGGFSVFEHVLPYYCEEPDIYRCLLSMMLGLVPPADILLSKPESYGFHVGDADEVLPRGLKKDQPFEDRRSLSFSSLVEEFFSAKPQIVCGQVFPVLMAMLQHNVRLYGNGPSSFHHHLGEMENRSQRKDPSIPIYSLNKNRSSQDAKDDDDGVVLKKGIEKKPPMGKRSRAVSSVSTTTIKVISSSSFSTESDFISDQEQLFPGKADLVDSQESLPTDEDRMPSIKYEPDAHEIRKDTLLLDPSSVATTSLSAQSLSSEPGEASLFSESASSTLGEAPGRFSSLRNNISASTPQLPSVDQVFGNASSTDASEMGSSVFHSDGGMFASSSGERNSSHSKPELETVFTPPPSRRRQSLHRTRSKSGVSVSTPASMDVTLRRLPSTDHPNPLSSIKKGVDSLLEEEGLEGQASTLSLRITAPPAVKAESTEKGKRSSHQTHLNSMETQSKGNNAWQRRGWELQLSVIRFLAHIFEHSSDFQQLMLVKKKESKLRLSGRMLTEIASLHFCGIEQAELEGKNGERHRSYPKPEDTAPWLYFQSRDANQGAQVWLPATSVEPTISSVTSAWLARIVAVSACRHKSGWRVLRYLCCSIPMAQREQQVARYRHHLLFNSLSFLSSLLPTVMFTEGARHSSVLAANISKLLRFSYGMVACGKFSNGASIVFEVATLAASGLDPHLRKRRASKAQQALKNRPQKENEVATAVDRVSLSKAQDEKNTGEIVTKSSSVGSIVNSKGKIDKESQRSSIPRARATTVIRPSQLASGELRTRADTSSEAVSTLPSMSPAVYVSARVDSQKIPPSPRLPLGNALRNTSRKIAPGELRWVDSRDRYRKKESKKSSTMTSGKSSSSKGSSAATPVAAAFAMAGAIKSMASGQVQRMADISRLYRVLNNISLYRLGVASAALQQAQNSLMSFDDGKYHASPKQQQQQQQQQQRKRQINPSRSRVQKRLALKKLQVVLDGMIHHQRTLFSRTNADVSFIRSLCNRLYRYIMHENQPLRQACCTLWKLLLITKSSIMDSILIIRVRPAVAQAAGIEFPATTLSQKPPSAGQSDQIDGQLEERVQQHSLGSHPVSTPSSSSDLHATTPRSTAIQRKIEVATPVTAKSMMSGSGATIHSSSGVVPAGTSTGPSPMKGNVLSKPGASSSASLSHNTSHGTGHVVLNIREEAFDLLLEKGQQAFTKWLQLNGTVVKTVLVRTIGDAWSEYVANLEQKKKAWERDHHSLGAHQVQLRYRLETEVHEVCMHTEQGRSKSLTGFHERAAERARLRKREARNRLLYCLSLWQRLRALLCRSRGAWGSDQEDHLIRHRLDATELPARIRPRMVSDPEFFFRYPCIGEVRETNSRAGHLPWSLLAQEYFERYDAALTTAPEKEGCKPKQGIHNESGESEEKEPSEPSASKVDSSSCILASLLSHPSPKDNPTSPTEKVRTETKKGMTKKNQQQEIPMDGQEVMPSGAVATTPDVGYDDDPPVVRGPDPLSAMKSKSKVSLHGSFRLLNQSEGTCAGLSTSMPQPSNLRAGLMTGKPIGKNALDSNLKMHKGSLNDISFMAKKLADDEAFSPVAFVPSTSGLRRGGKSVSQRKSIDGAMVSHPLPINSEIKVETATATAAAGQQSTMDTTVQDSSKHDSDASPVAATVSALSASLRKEKEEDAASMEEGLSMMPKDTLEDSADYPSSDSSQDEDEGGGVSDAEDENDLERVSEEEGVDRREKEDEEELEEEEEDNDDVEDEEDEDEDEMKKLTRLLDPGESVDVMYNCKRVHGLDSTDCILLFCSHCMYLVDGYRLDDEGQLVDLTDEVLLLDSSSTTGKSFLNKEEEMAKKERVIPAVMITTSSAGSLKEMAHQMSTSASHRDRHATRKWAYEEVRGAVRRRYLLRWSAMEVFSADGRNVLLVVGASNLDSALSLIQTQLKKIKSSAYDLGGNNALDLTGCLSVQLGLLAEMGNRKFTSYRQRCGDLTQQWVSGKLSNFEYLMHLNTRAGRSYNDLTQYPVFPWVLKDYCADHLDLSDPASYRDLRLPMGAQSPERARKFAERYEMWEAEENEGVPKWHYGTHYSSAGIVLCYLLRMEPFTQQFLQLQGGRFDVPDRTFSSLQETWEGASGTGDKGYTMADVKELIPEFFYLPRMFYNENRFQFGKQHTGEEVNHVELPPWAQGSAEEFVRVHRLALESDYVSENLHHWIDLIFGYKQQGEAAAASLNVFYYLTYEGAVDIDSIRDPTQRQSVIAQINNFGQTPRQLFKKPHPQRKIKKKHGFRLFVFGPQVRPTATRVSSSTYAQIKNYDVAIASEKIKETLDVEEMDSRSSQKSPSPLASYQSQGKSALSPLQVSTSPTGVRKKENQSPENFSLRFLELPISSSKVECNLHYGIGKLYLIEGKCVALSSQKILLAPTFEHYLSFGYEDSSMRSFGLDNHKLLNIVENLHRGQINELCLSSSGRMLVSGGDDAVVNIFRVTKIRKRYRFYLMRALCGHSASITALAVSRSCSIAVSGSENGNCIVWDLNRLCIGCSLLGHEKSITAIKIHHLNGEIVTASGSSLRVWNVNGKLQSHVYTAEAEDMITSLEISVLYWWAEESQVYITGHHSGLIRVWRKTQSADLGVVLVLHCHLQLHEQAVTALYLSADEKTLLSGDAGGRVVRTILDVSMY